MQGEVERMTGTSDTPQEANDKIDIEAPTQSDQSAISDERANSNKETKRDFAKEEFGMEESDPITWDNIVHGKSQNQDLTEPSHCQTAIFEVEVDNFMRTLNENGLTSLSWQSSIASDESQRSGEVYTFIFQPDEDDSADDDDDDDDKTNDTVDSTNRRARNLTDSDPRAEQDVQIHRRFSPGNSSNASPVVTGVAKPFRPSQKRFVLGSEIALAVVIAAAGATRLRAGVQKSRPRAELIPGDHTGSSNHSTKVSLEQSIDSVTSGEKKTLNEIDKISQQKRANNPAKMIRPKTIVASTDTLVSIAEAFFYDRNVAWLIADINQAILKETWMDDKRIVELKSRQQIELPLKVEIEQFYSSKPDHARAENLVTIVEETAVDLELLNNSLGDLLDSKQE